MQSLELYHLEKLATNLIQLIHLICLTTPEPQQQWVDTRLCSEVLASVSLRLTGLRGGGAGPPSPASLTPGSPTPASTVSASSVPGSLVSSTSSSSLLTGARRSRGGGIVKVSKHVVSYPCQDSSSQGERMSKCKQTKINNSESRQTDITKMLTA